LILADEMPLIRITPLAYAISHYAITPYAIDIAIISLTDRFQPYWYARLNTLISHYYWHIIDIDTLLPLFSLALISCHWWHFAHIDAILFSIITFSLADTLRHSRRHFDYAIDIHCHWAPLRHYAFIDSHYISFIDIDITYWAIAFRCHYFHILILLTLLILRHWYWH
jgi:hypothetical protein